MPDILQLLQSLGLSVETIARISAWWVTLQLVCKLAETHLQRALTWLTDRIDDFAGAKEDGQVLLRLVEHRAYRVLAWMARFLFRVILPNRASIEARWARIEKENEAEKEKGPNCFTPMLALSVLSACTGLLLLTGCFHRPLAPDGIYRGDRILYTAEQTTAGAYDTLDAFVTWEHANRAALAAWPEIRKSADHVRRNAERWINSAVALTEAYRIDPSEANRTALEKSLTTLRAALTEAGTHMATQR